MESNNRHHIAFLGFDRIQLLDLVGPFEAFDIANKSVDGRKYRPFIVSENPTFTSESRIRVLSDYQIDDTPKIDTLFVPGGVGARDPEISKNIRQWIDRQFADIPRIVTVCTGLFMIADHPYLQNKEVVTHWAFAEQLQRQYPLLKVNHDRLFIQQGKFYSSAGILSGIDLALNLIERDHGVDVATQVAKYLVTYLKRSGHQSQFSEPLKFQSSNNSHIQQLNRWLTRNHASPVTVSVLAEAVHVSERHLNRLIKAHFHMSAGKYIEHVKLEQSKIYLSKQETPVEVAAYKVGYASSDAFRRSFKRKYGISPQSYQLRFQ
jgi:transcriptional regulator GlxA family with amidase domain